ncbi:dethiobiotin synthase [Clostridiaceae bacterium 35-E11]
MTKGIFITGTGTDVGKTIVSAGLLYLLRSSGYSAVYYKAALSGALADGNQFIPGDTRFVSQFAGLTEAYENMTPYVYKTAVSPHLAARLENQPIDLTILKEKFKQLQQKYDYIVMEGSGGIACPLIDKDVPYLLHDFVKELGLDIIIVASAGLGTINHTLLTIKYIESLGMTIKGVIINGYKKNDICADDNISTIQRLTNVPILGILPWIEEIDCDNVQFGNLREQIKQCIHIENFISCMNDIL